MAGNPFTSADDHGGITSSNRPWVDDLRFESPRPAPPAPSTISGTTAVAPVSQQPQVLRDRFDPLPRDFSVNEVQTTFRHELHRLRRSNLPIPENVEKGAQLEADIAANTRRLEWMENERRKDELGHRGRVKEWWKKRNFYLD